MAQNQFLNRFSEPKKPIILPDPFEWIFISAGKVRLRYPPYNQIDSVIAEVESFYIAKYPITNAQYTVYVKETGQKPEHTRL